MSKIEVGSIVKFTGFKQQPEIDTASLDELEQMFPSFTPDCGCWFEVKRIDESGVLYIRDADAIDNTSPLFLFPNEVEIVE